MAHNGKNDRYYACAGLVIMGLAAVSTVVLTWFMLTLVFTVFG